MSSQKSAPPLKVELRPSRWLASLILFAHGGALAVLVPLTLPIWALAPLVGLVTGSLIYTLKTHAMLRGPLTIRRVIWDSDNDWSLHAASGEQLAVRFCPAATCIPCWSSSTSSSKHRRSVSRRAASCSIPDAAPSCSPKTAPTPPRSVSYAHA